MQKGQRVMVRGDHCRIGSLEIADAAAALADLDHCRIGSLENAGIRR